jgi:hypothetical protein
MAKLAIEWLKRIATGETTGYDVRPAEAVLRGALKSDDLAANAIDALAKVGTAQVQQDLIATAATASRPAAIRLQATDAALRHAVSFGRLATPANTEAIAAAATNEPDAALRSRMAALKAVLAGQPGDLAKAILSFAPASLQPPAPKKADEKKEPAPMPAGDDKPKDEPKPNP